jgi:hypothetical protein
MIDCPRDAEGGNAAGDRVESRDFLYAGLREPGGGEAGVPALIEILPL